MSRFPAANSLVMAGQYCRASRGLDGRSPKLAAFAAQNDPLDRFAR
jgi:hypothetical protein